MIPLVDLTAQYKDIREEIDHAILSVIIGNDFIKGKYVKTFEKEFSEYIGTKYCSGCNSGTDALFLILKALKIKENDEVIIPALTFFATAESVIRTGAKPVICDVDNSGLIDLSTISKYITKNTKVIIPVHLWGYPADMEKLLELGAKHNIFIVEDCAQAHGAYTGEKFKDKAEPDAFNPKKKTGSFGIASAFSFYPGKNLGAYGDAGAVVTNDEALYNEIESLKDHGRKDKYVHDKVGYNSRLDGLQASILSVKLKYIDRWNTARKSVGRKYNTILGNINEIELPIIMRGCVLHLYVIRTDKRDELLKHLSENNIMAGVHYPLPLHLQPALAYLGYKKGDFPVSERLAETVLSLPCYPEITEEQIKTVSNHTIEFFRN